MLCSSTSISSSATWRCRWDCDPSGRLHDLATLGGLLYANKVDAFLISHHSGLRVLAAPIRPDQTGAISTEFMTDVISVLRNEFEYIVARHASELQPGGDRGSRCVLVHGDGRDARRSVTQERKARLETLDSTGYPPERVRVVLNRANTSVGITSRDVANILERTPDVLIPSSRDITMSVNEGNPIASSHRSARTRLGHSTRSPISSRRRR